MSAAVDMKRFSNHKGHLLLRRFAEQRTRPYLIRQTAPEVISTGGAVDARIRWPVTLDGLQHQVAFLSAALAQGQQVPVKQVFAQKLRDQPLAQRSRVQVKDLFMQ